MLPSQQAASYEPRASGNRFARSPTLIKNLLCGTRQRRRIGRFSGGVFCPTASIGNADTKIPARDRNEKKSRRSRRPPKERIGSGRGRSTCQEQGPSPAAPNVAHSCRISRIPSGNVRSAGSICTPANSANTSTRPAASNAISRFPPESRPKTSATTARSIPSA